MNRENEQADERKGILATNKYSMEMGFPLWRKKLYKAVAYYFLHKLCGTIPSHESMSHSCTSTYSSSST